MDIVKYKYVQTIAKQTLEELANFIHAESTENSIEKMATELLRRKGVNSTWYHNVPSFVLLGSRSCLSISGKDYTPADEPVGETNLVTVDLSPLIDGFWGDCARSFCVESGRVVTTPTNEEFKKGLEIQQSLHASMLDFVNTETLFSDLYTFANHIIEANACDNLDFLANLGHSIEVSSDSRRFIDKNCHEKISNVPLFTFEPHIRLKGGEWGFKHENIYYFDESGNVVEL